MDSVTIIRLVLFGIVGLCIWRAFVLGTRFDRQTDALWARLDDQTTPDSLPPDEQIAMIMESLKLEKESERVWYSYALAATFFGALGLLTFTN
ncbi:MAG TPA: hypothetical protein VEB18_03850 [Candidatus Paceibacterota bacterium]|nr:hypothetical protein [Candidatus Paceibacterota bacterium]